MKYEDKFTSLGQVNSPNSWDKFQICCTDVFDKISTEFRGILRVFVNFAALLLLEISEAPYLWAASFTYYKLVTKNLHLATTFLRLVAKRRPEDFFNFEPWFLLMIAMSDDLVVLPTSLIVSPSTHMKEVDAT